MIESIKTLLNQGWIGSSLGLIGVLLAIVFYLRSKVTSKLVFQTAGTRLIGDKGQLPDEVTVNYRDIPVQALSTSTVIIWNSGSALLDGSALVADDPLRFEFGPGAKVLSAEVVKVSRPALRFTATLDDSHGSVVLTFSFLDPDDGAVIRVLHTGKRIRPIFHGTIKGLPKGCVDLGGLSSDDHQRRPKGIGSSMLAAAARISVLALGIAVAASGISPRVWEALNWFPVETRPTEDRIAWFTLVAGIVFTLGAAALIIMLRRRHPKSLVTEEAVPELPEGKAEPSS